MAGLAITKRAMAAAHRLRVSMDPDRPDHADLLAAVAASPPGGRRRAWLRDLVMAGFRKVGPYEQWRAKTQVRAASGVVASSVPEAVGPIPGVSREGVGAGNGHRPTKAPSPPPMQGPAAEEGGHAAPTGSGRDGPSPHKEGVIQGPTGQQDGLSPVHRDDEEANKTCAILNLL